MAYYTAKGGSYEPEKDAGLGLIYRLNGLWEKVDRRALSGNMKAWNFVLDRVFVNLLYRNEVEVEYDVDGNVVDVKLGKKDKQIYELLNKKIKIAYFHEKKAMQEQKIKDFKKAKEEIYDALMFKDAWLRKFMQQHRLYLKESERSPGTSLFGGG